MRRANLNIYELKTGSNRNYLSRFFYIELSSQEKRFELSWPELKLTIVNCHDMLHTFPNNPKTSIFSIWRSSRQPFSEPLQLLQICLVCKQDFFVYLFVLVGLLYLQRWSLSLSRTLFPKMIRCKSGEFVCLNQTALLWKQKEQKTKTRRLFYFWPHKLEDNYSWIQSNLKM